MKISHAAILFTSAKIRVIIYLVKKLTFAASALAVLLSTISLYGVAYGASAQTDATDSGQTYYGEDGFERELLFRELTDYATDGENFAFALDGGLVLFTTEERGETDAVGSLSRPLADSGSDVTVIGVEYSDGVLYVDCGEDGSYLYDGGLTACDFVFSSEEVVSANGYYYFFDGDDLCALNKNITRLGEGYTLLKAYGNFAYAFKDGVLVRIEGTQSTPLSFIYKDFSGAGEIRTGDTFELLKTSYSGRIFTVAAGAYRTEVDLDQTDGEYFKTKETVKLTQPMQALELCVTGNASIVLATADGVTESYIVTAPQDESAYTEVPETACDLTEAVTVSATSLYSCPYISNATRISPLDKGVKLRVTEKFRSELTDTVFYKVEYGADGTPMVGYVAENLLYPYEFSADTNQPARVEDTFDYTTNAETVMIVLIIVGIVILAIAYLTVVGTRGKDKKKAKTETEKQETEPRDDADGSRNSAYGIGYGEYIRNGYVDNDDGDIDPPER